MVSVSQAAGAIALDGIVGNKLGGILPSQLEAISKAVKDARQIVPKHTGKAHCTHWYGVTFSLAVTT